MAAKTESVVQSPAKEELPVVDTAGSVQSTATEPEGQLPTGEGGQFIAVGGGRVIPVPKE